MVETVSYNKKFEVMFDSLFLGCAEETDVPDPGGGDESENSSVSEGNKENAIAPSKVLLSRRQKKNKIRKEDNNSPVLKKMTRKTSKRSSESFHAKKWSSSTMCLRHINKLNVDESEIYSLLRNYLLTPEQAMVLGYPIESSLYPGRAIIYKSCGSPKSDVVDQIELPRQTHLFDVNAREFVPSCDNISSFVSKRNNNNNYTDFIGEYNMMNHSPEQNNTMGGDFLESSESDKSEEDRSVDSDLADDKNSDKDVETSQQVVITEILKRYQTGSDEKKCARCDRGFFVLKDGEYLTREKCIYHWGKLQKVYGTSSNGVVFVKSEFSCCKGKKNSKGCSTAKLHVWKGVSAGVNKPLEGFVKTKSCKMVPEDGNYGVYSVDCEMCYTTQGLELAKVTVVAADGRIIYDSYVKPENTIIDYNTRFSGITAKDLKGNAAKSLKDVQHDLMSFINADTILIGHGLENDLKALKMIHSTVIDTSMIFPHYYGLPFKRSLRSLVKSILKREIQSFEHDSYEDAKSCMELMLWRLKKDYKSNFDQKNHTIEVKF